MKPWAEKALRDLYFMHGQTPKKFCKECVHLLRVAGSRSRCKCELTAYTGGASTDWSESAQACGYFGQRKEERRGR